MASDNTPNNIQPDENTIEEINEKESWWHKHRNSLTIISNLAIAGATVFLALVTFIHVRTTTNMSKQTKRLADLSVEQFKIRAYPAFMIEFKEVKFAKDKLREVYKVFNKGEITAQKVTFLWVHGYTKGSKKMFINKTGTYYKIDEKMTTVDFEGNIFSKSAKQLISESSLYKDFKIENLLYGLLFIKFWVPYDSKYRYESFGFLLNQEADKKNKKLLKWQGIDINAKKNFINNYFETSYVTDEKIKNFFEDYPMKSVSIQKSDS